MTMQTRGKGITSRTCKSRGRKPQGRLQRGSPQEAPGEVGRKRALHKLLTVPLNKFHRWGMPVPLSVSYKCLFLCLSVLDDRPCAVVSVPFETSG